MVKELGDYWRSIGAHTLAKGTPIPDNNVYQQGLVYKHEAWNQELLFRRWWAEYILRQVKEMRHPSYYEMAQLRFALDPSRMPEFAEVKLGVHHFHTQSFEAGYVLTLGNKGCSLSRYPTQITSPGMQFYSDAEYRREVPKIRKVILPNRAEPWGFTS